VPSQSTAKSFFAGLSLAYLVKKYGESILNTKISSYIPEMANNSNWKNSPATFRDLSNMAAGNYDSTLPEASVYSDESPTGTVMAQWFDAVTYSAKLH
jgi:hypothetical protein